MQTAGGNGDCLFNPRYSDCLKERLLQTLAVARQPQQAQFDGHGCQGPVPALPGEAIDIGHLLAMRTGWGACAGPYPAFRVPQQQQQHHLRGGGGGVGGCGGEMITIITQENLLTAMRARRLGPLRRPSQPPPPPLLLPAATAADTARSSQQLAAESGVERRPPPPDTCSGYRDLKDRSRHAPQPPPLGRRSLPQLPLPLPQSATSATGEPQQALERQAPLPLALPQPLQLAEQPTLPLPPATSRQSPTFSRQSGGGGGLQAMPGMEMPALSLSFSYNRFRERLSRWEVGAVAASPLAQHQQLQQQHLQRRPAGLQIRSVLVADSGNIRGSAGPVEASAAVAAAAGGATLRGRQRRRVLSNQRR